MLTPRECGTLGGVAGMTEQEEVLLRFSVKEAVYKAAHPFLHRPLGFKDVRAVSEFGIVILPLGLKHSQVSADILEVSADTRETRLT